MNKNIEDLYQKAKNEEWSKRPDLRKRFEALEDYKNNNGYYKMSKEDEKEYESLKKTQEISKRLPNAENVVQYIKMLDVIDEKISNMIMKKQAEANVNKNIEGQKVAINKIHESDVKVSEIVMKQSNLKKEISNKRVELDVLKTNKNLGKGSVKDDQEIQTLTEEMNSLKDEFNDLTAKRQALTNSKNVAVEEKSQQNENAKASMNKVNSLKDTKFSAAISDGLEGLSLEELTKKRAEVLDKKRSAELTAFQLLNGKSVQEITESKSSTLEGKEQESQKVQPGGINLLKASSEPKTDPDPNPNQPKDKHPVEKDQFEKAFPWLAKRFPNMKNNFLGKFLMKARTVFHREEKDDSKSKTKQQPSQQANQNQNQTQNQKAPEELRKEFKDEIKQNQRNGKVSYIDTLLSVDIDRVAEEGLSKVAGEKLEENNPTKQYVTPEQREEFAKKQKEVNDLSR